MKCAYVIIVCFLFSCTSSRQEIYEKKINELQLKLEGLLNYNSLIDSFKEVGGRFPDSLYEVYLVYKQNWPEEINQLELNHFIDIFSKNDEWIGYFPIYDSSDTKIISYVILSAGIDGKLDNFVDPSNKLHMDDWMQKLKLYNPDDYNLNRYIKGNISKHPYNVREERFGRKDLLIYVYH